MNNVMPQSAPGYRRTEERNLVGDKHRFFDKEESE